MKISYSKICLIVSVLLAIITLNASNVIADSQKEVSDTAGTVQQNSSSWMLAPIDREPLVIDAAFKLHAINNINDKDEAFEFIGVLILKWKDSRLAFDPSKEQLSEKIYQGDYQINQVFNGWSPQPVLLNQSGMYQINAQTIRIQPDGSVTFSQMINAIAEVKLSMRRLPFDSQKLEAVFSIFDFENSKVALRTSSDTLNNLDKEISIDQWHLKDIKFSIREPLFSESAMANSSLFVVTLDVHRDSFFLLRLVILPLAFIVMLVWSVFWIDRASMGDRINICFVGILTAVAYQIVLGDRLPQISYMTFINAFLNISFVMMSATVVINLIIGSLDKAGNVARADIIEQRSRWILPLTYLGLVLLALSASFIFFD